MIQQLRLRPLRILLLFSDTGGGHRSAAEALIEAWQAEHPGAVEVEMVDVFRHYTPFPFNRFGPSYPWIVKYFSRAYASVFYSSDTPRRARTVARAAYAYVRQDIRRLLAEHQSDIIVSVHPLFNHCVNWAMRKPAIVYVVQSGVGVWAPQPERAAAQLREWLVPDNPALAAMSRQARQLADADAASDIAADILELAERCPPSLTGVCP